MKRLLYALIIALCIVSNIAIAESVTVPGWSNLSDTQKAEIKLQAARAAEQTKAGPVSPAKVQEWVNVGKSIGVGFGAAAKEIGVGVDELMKSDTGKIAMFLIVWNYIGNQFIGIIGGTLWFMIFIPLWLKMFFRYGTNPEYIKDNDSNIIKTNYNIKSDDAVVYFSVVAVLILGIGFLLIFGSRL